MNEILHINTSDKGGGAENIALNLVNNSNLINYLFVKNKYTQCKNVLEFPTFFIGKLYSLLQLFLYKLGYAGDLKTTLSLSDEFNMSYRRLKNNKYYSNASIIHLHNLHGGYFDIKSLRDLGKEKIIIWTLHDMWALTGGEVHTFDHQGFRTGNALTPYKTNYPLDNPLIERRKHYLNLKKKIYAELGERITFVAVSNWMRKNLLNSYVISAKNSMKLIYNGIDNSKFINRKQRDWKIPRVLFFNSASPFKGSELFISALEKIKIPFHINVVGIPLRSDRVISHLDTIKNTTELVSLYNDSDILIFPSRAENFPLTVLEAMSCGVIVVASDAGGIPEALDSRCGFLFQAGDLNNLIYTLETCLNNSQEFSELRENASNKVKNEFSLIKMVKEYDQLYMDLLNK